MSKRFNITGVCVPKMHYMVNINGKLETIIRLVDDGEYFTINRPRQYGKTTTLFMLENRLNILGEYFVIFISFEGIGDLVFENEERFSKEFLQILMDNIEQQDTELYNAIKDREADISSLSDLSKYITWIVGKLNKKVILMIDEVDKSSNNQLFLSFLGMLRNKYMLRNMGKDKTFYSVILAGVHDVKNLKLKLRPAEEQKFNSPWNIATDFTLDMSFSETEISTMLMGYCEDRSCLLDIQYFANKIYFYTSGHPMLVSLICKLIDENIIVNDKEKELIDGKITWKKEYITEALREVLKCNSTNFKTLIKNMENDEKLRDLIYKISVEGEVITYNEDNALIDFGIMYGILKDSKGKVVINNPIYQQRIYNYFSSLIETSSKVGAYNNREKFINENGDLDIKEILVKFQDFLKHEYSDKSKTFLEAEGRLLFLAFISPIINGVGFAFKEIQGGEERRFDVVITYNRKMYMIELKVWHGEVYINKGHNQLLEYMQQYNLSEGYLIIFDFRKNKSLKGEIKEINIQVDDKTKKIVEAYC